MGMGVASNDRRGGLGVYPSGNWTSSPTGQKWCRRSAGQRRSRCCRIGKKIPQLLSGKTAEWQEHPQEKLYEIMPEDRRYAYEVRKIITVLADQNSVLELVKSL